MKRAKDKPLLSQQPKISNSLSINTEKKPLHRIGRSAHGYSYKENGNHLSDEHICEWLMELLAGEGVGLGYRKLTVLLKRRHQLVINKKKVYRLCKRLEVLPP